MQYMGSKRKIAKYILPIILKERKPDQYYIEPFCGGCNTLDLVNGKRIGSDIHYELICYFAALSVGWLPPKYINEDDYNRIKKGNDAKLKGYVGFSMSFAGKYFASQSRHIAGIKGAYKSLSTDNTNGYRNAVKQQTLLKGVNFFHCSYDKLRLPTHSLIYCDPPYAGTTLYKNQTASFNYNVFYDWCRLQKAKGHQIFISEKKMPPDFKCVWEKETTMIMNQKKGPTLFVEKLFTL